MVGWTEGLSSMQVWCAAFLGMALLGIVAGAACGVSPATVAASPAPLVSVPPEAQPAVAQARAAAAGGCWTWAPSPPTWRRRRLESTAGSTAWWWPPCPGPGTAAASAAASRTRSRYRNRIRARHTLERLAAKLGFADHARLSRVVRAESGAIPSRFVPPWPRHQSPNHERHLVEVDPLANRFRQGRAGSIWTAQMPPTDPGSGMPGCAGPGRRARRNLDRSAPPGTARW